MGYTAVLLLGSLWNAVAGFPGQNTPPVFDLKREWLILENEPLGSRIATVRARDDDKDPIEYGIEPAVFLDGSSYFRIDKKTGEVFLSSLLDGLAGSDYYLFITANDGHQLAKIEVYVRILPPNTSPPPKEDSSLTPGHPSSFGGRYRPFNPVYGPLPGRMPGPPYPIPPRPNSHRPRTSTKPPVSLPAIDGKLVTDVPLLESPILSSMYPVITDIWANDTFEPDSSTELNEKQNTIGWPSTVFPIVATLAFTPVVVALLWLLHKRCKTREKSKVETKLSERRGSELSSELDGNPHISVLYLQRSRIANSNRYESGESTGMIPENRKWEFPRHHLRFLGMLGEGCFGQVWKCEALNICNSEGACLVAVKTLKENASEKEKKDLVSELEVMKLLEPHQNVVTLLGCCTDRDPMFLIMEFVANGKLQSYLRESRAERFYGNLYGSSRHLTSRDLTAFAYQVAKGMEYLSSKGIIHRDLAARNILVGDNKTCKVADFGFARDVIMNHVYERKSEGRLPIRWMAPESLYDNIFTTKTDVWSFGIVMWEIVTLGSTPYPGMAAADVMRKVREGYRLEKPEHCKREMYNIMFYCWDRDANKRPNFTELVQLMDRLLISENEYIELDRFPDHSYYNISNLSGEKL